MKFLLICLVSFLAPWALSAAEGTSLERFHLRPEGEKAIGYCQAVRVGDLLYISGSVGDGPMPEAIAKAMGTLEATLKAHGLSFKDVVKETVYATDLDAFIANSGVRRKHYGDTFPAATWVGVQRLFRPEFVVEIELIAAFPRG
ncbi:MAG: RidA family protein [Opitutaceae bacterium]|nr:RidA family protein [Opitutaceae bacterium]